MFERVVWPVERVSTSNTLYYLLEREGHLKSLNKKGVVHIWGNELLPHVLPLLSGFDSQLLHFIC